MMMMMMFTKIFGKVSAQVMVRPIIFKRRAHIVSDFVGLLTK